MRPLDKQVRQKIVTYSWQTNTWWKAQNETISQRGWKHDCLMLCPSAKIMFDIRVYGQILLRCHLWQLIKPWSYGYGNLMNYFGVPQKIDWICGEERGLRNKWMRPTKLWMFSKTPEHIDYHLFSRGCMCVIVCVCVWSFYPCLSDTCYLVTQMPGGFPLSFPMVFLDSMGWWFPVDHTTPTRHAPWQLATESETKVADIGGRAVTQIHGFRVIPYSHHVVACYSANKTNSS